MTTTATKTQVESVGGRSMIGVTWFLKNKLLWCIGEVERIKGSPALTPEVTVVFFKYYTRIFPSGVINAFI